MCPTKIKLKMCLSVTHWIEFNLTNDQKIMD